MKPRKRIQKPKGAKLLNNVGNPVQQISNTSMTPAMPFDNSKKMEPNSIPAIQWVLIVITICGALYGAYKGYIELFGKPKLRFNLDDNIVTYVPARDLTTGQKFYVISFLFSGVIRNDGTKPLHIKNISLKTKIDGREVETAIRPVPDTLSSRALNFRVVVKNGGEKDLNKNLTLEPDNGQSGYLFFITNEPMESFGSEHIVNYTLICTDQKNKEYEYEIDEQKFDPDNPPNTDKRNFEIEHL
jgi:hypothetical protein